METFYTRVNKWRNQGFRTLVSCSKWNDGAILVSTRRVLRQHEIEYHNVKNSVGRSIYVKREDLARARDLMEQAIELREQEENSD